MTLFLNLYQSEFKSCQITVVSAENAAMSSTPARTPAKTEKHLFVSEKVSVFFSFFRNNQMFFSIFAGLRAGVELIAAFSAETTVTY